MLKSIFSVLDRVKKTKKKTFHIYRQYSIRKVYTRTGKVRPLS